MGSKDGEDVHFYKKAAAFVLQVVGKHSPQLAQAIVDCGALDMLVICLKDFDLGVKDAAAWVFGCIARHNAELSQAVEDAGAVPLLLLCIQDPEIALKRLAALVLTDISKHSPELAQAVVDAEAIAHLAMILNLDVQLKHQFLSALCQIAKHSVDLGEMVKAEIFPAVLAMKDKDEYMKKDDSTSIGDTAKYIPELSQLIVNTGGVAAMTDCTGSCKGNIKLPGIMMLGYSGSHSENLAMAVIISKSKKAIILQKCTLPVLEPFQHDAPSNILKHVVGQFSKVLPHNSKARHNTKLFVTSSELKKDQEIKAEPGSLLQEYINNINNCYLEETVRHYSPRYLDVLLQRVDSYQPLSN
ncbi:LOW QUALITY PROTEIN: sperm-associated antigen 6 [Glossophaga mutica]